MLRIWIHAELEGGALHPVALELLACARQLGEAEAVVLGPGAEVAADALGEHGAVRVRVCPSELFADHSVEPATDTLAALIADGAPDVVLFGATANGRDLAGRLAARLGVGAISNAVAVRADDDALRAQVPYFGGAKLATYRVDARPAFIVVRPRSYEAVAVGSAVSGGPAEVLAVDAVLRPTSTRTRVVERQVEAVDQVRLEDATVVVAGGRGLGAAEHYKLIEDAAALLGGAAGASRAIVDAGWAPYATQIGQTGKTVRPDVYLAAGISGAIQHTVGMKDAKVIIAINKDVEAPILKIADLGVVGDALEILPRLTEAIRSRQTS
jgi:electron transfer flavoprotein alpha subunit